MKKLVILALLLCPLIGLSQNPPATTGYHRVNQVFARAPQGVQAQVVPYASVMVTVTSTGVAATIYSDPLLTSTIPGSSVVADDSGNYDFYLPLNYLVTETISSPGQGSTVIINVGANISSFNPLSPGPLGVTTPDIGAFSSLELGSPCSPGPCVNLQVPAGLISNVVVTAPSAPGQLALVSQLPPSAPGQAPGAPVATVPFSCLPATVYSTANTVNCAWSDIGATTVAINTPGVVLPFVSTATTGGQSVTAGSTVVYPTVSGVITFTASNSAGATISTAPITVLSQALFLTTTSLTSGTVGSAYSVTLAATGGLTPYHWTSTGLPSGLTLDYLTGVLSGTPSNTFSTSTVVFTVTDSGTPPQNAAATLSMSVTSSVSALVNTNASPAPNAIIGTAYSYTYTFSGGTSPYTCSAVGALPTSVTLSGCALSGTPTGTYPTFGFPIGAVTAVDSSSPAQTIHMNGPLNSCTTSGCVPVVTLSASPNPVASGGTVTLMATCTDCASANISPIGYNTSTSATLLSFSPTTTQTSDTTYTLTGSNPVCAGSSNCPTKSVTVHLTSGAGTLGAAYTAYVAANYSGSPYNSGNTYYVAPTGSDSAAGSSGAPWLTLAHAAATVSGCGEIVVAPGTYSVSSGRVVKITANGTSICHTAYVSSTYGAAYLVAANNNANDPAVWVTGNYVDVVGFDITNPMGCMGVSGWGTYGGVIYNRVHDVDNGSGAYACTNGIGGGGLGQYTGATSATWTNNIVWNIGYPGNNWTHGIYISTAYNTIQNNVIYNASGACIQAFHQSSYNVITNNTLSTCGYQGFLFGGDSGYPYSNNVFSNNTLSGSANYDIDACGSSGCGVAIGSGNVFSNNNTASSGGNKITDLPGGQSLVNNISSTPNFVSVASPASGGNFTPNSGSPLLGTGTGTSLPDILGVTNTPNNIGAY